MLQISLWLSVVSLLISIASFTLAFYVMRSNGKFLLAKTRSDLLTKIAEARSQYKELNRRYRTLTARSKQISAQDIGMMAEYSQFEKNTDQYYQEVKDGSHTAAELENYRHSIEGMLIHISADMKRFDEWEKKLDGIS